MRKAKKLSAFLALCLLLVLALAACKNAPGLQAPLTQVPANTWNYQPTPSAEPSLEPSAEPTEPSIKPSETMPPVSGGTLSGMYASTDAGSFTFSGNNFTLTATEAMMGLTGSGDLNVEGTYTLSGNTITFTFDQAKLRASMIELIKKYAQSQGVTITDDQINTQVDAFMSSDTPFKTDQTAIYDPNSDTVNVASSVYSKQ